MNECCRIAIYMRLSKEDRDMKDESNSIINQRIMLKEYIRENFEYYVLKEFADDGFSGTNFQRPAVTDMLDQVREGKINCVIVKDFSRFSRDYIELGSYLDQIFPFLGVRFISLNDNYDSKKQGSNTVEIGFSFKGLMYDLYSKDLSVKVKSSLRARKEQGQYACGNTPFGYVKDQEDRHMLVVAEDEAEVVKRIFVMTLDGKTSVEIARLFNREKIPTPIEFRILKGQTSRKPIGKCFQWDYPIICSILRNPVYVGDMVYDKYEKDGVGGKNHIKPRSEWKVYKEHHVAIVSRDDFETVQKKRKQTGNIRTKYTGERHPLQGKVYCGGCGRAMTLRKNGLNPYFYCNQRYAYADTDDCVGNMNLMFLEQYILYQIDSELIRWEKAEKMKQKKEKEILEKLDILKKEMRKLDRKKEILHRKRLEEYEKAVFGRESHFQTEDTAMQDVNGKIAEIESEMDRMKELIPKRREGTIDFFNQGGKTELKFAEAMIRKITVYNEEHIEIEWMSDIEENAFV